MLTIKKESATPSKQPALKEVVWSIWPALAVCLATLVISVFITEFTYVAGLKAFWKVLFRFFRLLVILTLPILLLPLVFGVLRSLLNRKANRFIQLQDLQDYTIAPLKHWLLRPLQGIGLAMLIAAKLLVFLQIYTGASADAAALLPSVQFNPWRLISATAITAVTSLLLSILWTLDDLGVRYYNSKTKEVKMIGKYLGLLLPIFFGFYGIMNLFENYGQIEAVKYLMQMTIILYPPFLVFCVIHRYYIKARQHLLLKKLNVAS